MTLTKKHENLECHEIFELWAKGIPMFELIKSLSSAGKMYPAMKQAGADNG